MRISDWSSDVCSSDLAADPQPRRRRAGAERICSGLLFTACRRRPHHHRSDADLERRAGLPGYARPLHARTGGRMEIGRASWRERVCQYVKISVGAVSLKKKKYNIVL